MSPLMVVPRFQTVIVVLDVAGRQVGLPIANVQDVVKVRRAGPGPVWRVNGSTAGAICPPGFLATNDRCVPLVELSERLGLETLPNGRRLRAVVVVQSGEHVVGLLVDAVADIVEVACSAIRPVAPTAANHPAAQQIASLDAREIELMDIELLLATRRTPSGAWRLRAPG